MPARRDCTRTPPGVRDLKITVAYAEVGLSVLWPRRAAVDRRRSRMQIDHLGVKRSVHHLSALAGIKAKPSSGGDIRALFQTYRRFHAETCAVAKCKLGPCRCGDQQPGGGGNREGDPANHVAMLIGIRKAGNRHHAVRLPRKRGFLDFF